MGVINNKFMGGVEGGGDQLHGYYHVQVKCRLWLDSGEIIIVIRASALGYINTRFCARNFPWTVGTYRFQVLTYDRVHSFFNPMKISRENLRFIDHDGSQNWSPVVDVGIGNGHIQQAFFLAIILWRVLHLYFLPGRVHFTSFSEVPFPLYSVKKLPSFHAESAKSKGGRGREGRERESHKLTKETTFYSLGLPLLLTSVIEMVKLRVLQGYSKST